MNRTPRTIASLVATAVLSAGLVTVSAPASTAAPSAACRDARSDLRGASARLEVANKKVAQVNAIIRDINRKLSRLGTSPEDRNERAKLKKQRANANALKARRVADRNAARNDRDLNRNRVRQLC